MLDSELIEVFLGGGAHGFAESLHVEPGVLILDGFWHACLRVNDDCFILRNEEPPSDTTVLDAIAAAMRARGWERVADDLPGITVITMEKASLGYVSWQVWAPDRATAEAAVAMAVNDDSFLYQGDYYPDPERDADYSAEYHGARRLAGLPTSLVLSVGVEPARLSTLATALEDCHFVEKKLGEIEADACCSLIPTLILVDATSRRGQEFVMQIRTAACGRVLPLVAVTADGSTPLGADVAVVAAADPATWAPPIRDLLP
ncbi:MAG TPA: hypothetical protein VM390_08665 [Acidimicrobiales bacterium]|jgi:hypothetical protein|nr:hypothetical protein [Acidimicrobiales bacterium]